MQTAGDRGLFGRTVRRWAALIAFLAIVAVACTAGTSPSPTTPAAPTGPPGTTTPSPSLAPTPPAGLNRDFSDSVAMRKRRDRLVDTYVAPVVRDQRVVAAMRAVPRHSFVPTASLDQAYDDHPVPIGYGQTISQPSLVAQMTELLQIKAGDHVLEIGTGSGYQAAILRQLTDQVYSVEIIPQLAAIARGVLDALGYRDISLDRRDAYYGWPEHAPYDAIIVTAAPDHLPRPLVEQLKPDGGRLVIPIGRPGDVQTLWLVTRHGEDVDMERITEVLFVPLTRE